MNSDQIYPIQGAVFYPWPTQEKIQMVPNCMIEISSNSDMVMLIQFCFSFITYRSCKHLDNKHTIFGRVVGGMETLTEMEKIEVDNKDLPIENIFIVKAQIFVNPYDEADEQVSVFFNILYSQQDEVNLVDSVD